MKVLIFIAAVLFSFSVFQLPDQEKEAETKVDTKTQDAKSKTKDAKPKAKIGSAVYDDFVEPWREKFVKAWETEVEQTKGSIKTYNQRARAAKNVSTRQYNVKLLKEAKEKLKTLEKNDPPFVYGGCQWGSEHWKVGDYGPTGETPAIHQIMDERRMLVGNDPNGPIFILQMESTEGLADGKTIDLHGNFIHVTGTTTYKTVIGASKTVLAVEIVDLNSLKTKD